jgi:hypothetical protein
MGVEAHELQEAWLNRALDSAGIDRGSWRPGRGVDENRRTVEAVYGYYGRLFLDHPYLEWAGLAGMIGPAFYAGFRDLGFLPDAVRGAVIALLGRGDLGFYETTFLTMQKKIFEDQAGMHEAYLAGGVAQIEEFYRARIMDAATLEAWRQIDAGRDAAAADGPASARRPGHRRTADRRIRRPVGLSHRRGRRLAHQRRGPRVRRPPLQHTRLHGRRYRLRASGVPGFSHVCEGDFVVAALFSWHTRA